MTVTLSDAKTGRSESLICTPEHPFFVPGSGWVEAGSLGIGTSIITRAGPQLAVTNVTWHRHQGAEKADSTGTVGFTVYNLTVEDDHTFLSEHSAAGHGYITLVVLLMLQRRQDITAITGAISGRMTLIFMRIKPPTFWMKIQTQMH